MTEATQENDCSLHQGTGLLEFFCQATNANACDNFLMWRFAKLTLWIKRWKQKETVEEIGKEWQRMFPTRLYANICEMIGDTIYGEISGTCPGAGTSDLHACYHLMEYDRQLLRHIGGEFIVLESKVNPSVLVCRVAIHVKGAITNDLIPAHQKDSNAPSP